MTVTVGSQVFTLGASDPEMEGLESEPLIAAPARTVETVKQPGQTVCAVPSASPPALVLKPPPRVGPVPPREATTPKSAVADKLDEVLSPRGPPPLAAVLLPPLRQARLPPLAVR